MRRRAGPRPLSRPGPARPRVLGRRFGAREGVSRCARPGRDPVMTDDEWLTCLDPDLLLDAAKAAKRLNARKSRLYSCACFRLVWDRIATPDVRVAVEKSEQRADRLISDQELERYRYPLGDKYNNVDHWLSLAIQSLAIPNSNPSYVAWSVRSSTENDIYRLA